ncbi:MAG: tRNA (adenosine(37)-N6)-threonylcarbamoyltransferase complex dimerization subunit type 1 TsaB [Verrucomicrobiota bacterium]
MQDEQERVGMTWLAIETSTTRGTVAWWEGGEVVIEKVFVSERGHNAAIFGPLGELLDAIGDRRGLDGIVVGTGPGSYGGVRVGIAVATGLSLAREVPVIGVPSLVAAEGVRSDDYTVVGDARRGSYFIAEVRGRRLVGEALLVEESEFLERLGVEGGVGGEVVTFDERPLACEAGPVGSVHPTAGWLARVVAGMGEGERAALEGKDLQPIYLRAPYITEPKK